LLTPLYALRIDLQAKFAANYTTHSSNELTEDDNTDTLPLAEDTKTGSCVSINFWCGVGHMCKRTHNSFSLIQSRERT